MSIGHHYLSILQVPQTQCLQLSSLSLICSLCPQSVFFVPCHRNDSVAPARNLEAFISAFSLSLTSLWSHPISHQVLFNLHPGYLMNQIIFLYPLCLLTKIISCLDHQNNLFTGQPHWRSFLPIHCPHCGQCDLPNTNQFIAFPHWL